MAHPAPAPLAGLRAVAAGTVPTPLAAIASAHAGPRPPCFARAAAWSPDGGSHVLLQRDDHRICVYRVSQGEGERAGDSDGERAARRGLCLTLAGEHASPSPLLAAQWYPFACAGPADDAAWMLLVSARDTPLRLAGACSGDTRYAYALPSHTETLLAAHSVLIAPAPPAAQLPPDTRVRPMALLYAGLGSATLAVLDVACPTPCAAARVPLGMRAGHAALQRARAQPASRAPRPLGQRGIVTCLALVPAALHSDAAELLAVGTSDGSVGLYDTAALSGLADVGGRQPWDPQRAQQVESLGLNACVAGWRVGVGAGASDSEKPEAVSQVLLLPGSSYLLAIAQRRHPGRVLVYDMRYVPRHAAPAVAAFPALSGAAYTSRVRAMVQDAALDFEAHAPASALVAVLSPGPAGGLGAGRGPTNQRIMFSVDRQGAWLASGAYEDGAVHFWDVREDALLDRSLGLVRYPSVSFRAHNDVVSSCAFHPYHPMLLTTSGSRHFANDEADSETESESESESESASDCESESGSARPRASESTAPPRSESSVSAGLTRPVSPRDPAPASAPSSSDLSVRPCAQSDSASSPLSSSASSAPVPAPRAIRRAHNKVFARDASAKLWDLR